MNGLDEQKKRIVEILGEDEGFIPEVSDETLRDYLDYLKQNIEHPCHLTGIEDFQWEEYYILGLGSKKEHERLRRSRPSYLDAFELIGFDDVDARYGILVEVRRLSDRKKFVLPLADLGSTDDKSGNYQLLSDYSVWYVNNR